MRRGAGEAGRGHIHSVLDSAHLNGLPAVGLVLFQVLGILEGTKYNHPYRHGPSILAEEKNNKPAK